MNKEIKDKLYDAKMGLQDLIDLYKDNALIQRRVIFALEAIDDALEGKIRFPKRCIWKKTLANI